MLVCHGTHSLVMRRYSACPEGGDEIRPSVIIQRLVVRKWRHESEV